MYQLSSRLQHCSSTARLTQTHRRPATTKTPRPAAPILTYRCRRPHPNLPVPAMGNTGPGSSDSAPMNASAAEDNAATQAAAAAAADAASSVEADSGGFEQRGQDQLTEAIGSNSSSTQVQPASSSAAGSSDSGYIIFTAEQLQDPSALAAAAAQPLQQEPQQEPQQQQQHKPEAVEQTEPELPQTILSSSPVVSTNTESSSNTGAGRDSEESAAANSSGTGSKESESEAAGSTTTSSSNSGSKQDDLLPPVNLTVKLGLDEEASDDEEDLLAGGQQQAGSSSSSSKAFVPPPPLIDPNVDIANDPAYAIRLLDILDQVSISSSYSSIEASADSQSAASAAADQQQQQQQQQQVVDSPYKFVRQPAPFCTNCCTPLHPLRPSAACSSCGHSPADDHLLFSHGVMSQADLATHTPPWLLQQQGLTAATAAAAGRSSKQAAAEDTALLLSKRLGAAISLRQARQLLQEAGVLQLPRTVLAWEDEEDETQPEPAMRLHRGLLPPNHERPERLQVILARLRAAGLLDVCDHLQPREATDLELLAVHDAGLIAAVSALSNANQPSDLNKVAAHLAPDTLGNRYTYRAARTAAGTAAELARQLVLGEASNGMALIRPLGQAAGVDKGEAGNYFNNAAVAVREAQRAGARRVMVLDWDVHHCKGTAEIFAEDPNVLVFSLHRYGSGYYPGTGAAEHVGIGRGRGRNINVAWCPPSVIDKRGRRIQVDAPPVSDGDYLTAWHMLVLPVAAEFRPDIILVSAGFDAADKDPLGQYRVHPECFGHLTALLRPLAPLGLLLEGGYNLAVTAACVEACVRALLGEKPAPLRGTRCAGVTGWTSILRTLLVHQEHWQSLGMLNFLQLATPPAEGWESQEEVDEEEEDEGYEVVVHGEEEEGEFELEEAEFDAALAAAAKEGEESTDGQVSKSVDDFEPSEILGVIQETPDVLQQVLDLLDQKIAAGKAAKEQEQLQQLEQQLLAAAAAEAAGLEQQQEETEEAEAAVQQQQQTAREQDADEALQSLSAVAAEAEAAEKSGSSGSSSSWSAGGFMDDMESVDSGSDDERHTPTRGSRTDWGLEQIDEEVCEHLPWYGAQHAQQQLKEAQEAAATAAAASAAAAMAAAEAAGAAEAAVLLEVSHHKAGVDDADDIAAATAVAAAAAAASGAAEAAAAASEAAEAVLAAEAADEAGDEGDAAAAAAAANAAAVAAADAGAAAEGAAEDALAALAGAAHDSTAASAAEAAPAATTAAAATMLDPACTGSAVAPAASAAAAAADRNTE